VLDYAGGKILLGPLADQPHSGLVCNVVLLRHHSHEEAMTVPAGATRLRVEEDGHADRPPYDALLEPPHCGEEKLVFDHCVRRPFPLQHGESLLLLIQVRAFRLGFHRRGDRCIQVSEIVHQCPSFLMVPVTIS
jgi:hypothetical protein